MPSSCSRSGSIVGEAVHGPYPVASQMQLDDVGHTQRSYELATADFLLEFFARCFRLIPPTPVSNCHLNSMI